MGRGGVLRVRLAGFNVDADTLKRCQQRVRSPLTPETLSAAYARISRSPLDIVRLRRNARRDVARARASNRTIIFDMGHHSVAEHAVFNFDIMAVSRLALEEIEQFRLASYTEKSQRYVTLAGDFVVPGEIRERGDRRLFVAAVERQNEFYRQALARLLERGKNSSDLSERQLEGQAKEDARYILSLATAGQVGMTLNARTLEHLFRRFRASRRQEVRRLGEKLFALVLPIAPSLILFPEPSAFELDVHAVLEEKLASRVPAKGPG